MKTRLDYIKKFISITQTSISDSVEVENEDSSDEDALANQGAVELVALLNLTALHP